MYFFSLFFSEKRINEKERKKSRPMPQEPSRRTNGRRAAGTGKPRPLPTWLFGAGSRAFFFGVTGAN
jgi:hypothetical protein